MFEDENGDEDEEVCINDTETRVNDEESVEKDSSSMARSTPHKQLCMLCGAGYLTERELEEHIGSVHETKCEECNKTFFDEFDLKMHKTTHNSSASISETHEASTPVKCEVCHRILATDGEVCHHEGEFHGLPPSGNPKVGQEDGLPSMEEMPNLEVEDQQFEEAPADNTNGSVEPTPPASEDVTGTARTVSSEVCDETPDEEPETNGPKDPEPIDNNEAIRKCTDCPFTANTDFAFQLHVLSEHSRPTTIISFPCSICGMTFSDIRHLDTHFKRCHTPTRNQEPNLAFPCQTCGVAFEELNELNIHVSKRHGYMGASESKDQNTRRLETDFKYYMKYVIEQNQEMMEEFSEFKKTVFRRFDNLADEQDRINEELKRMMVSRKKFEDDSTIREAENQKVIAKGFDTLVSGMRVLESHQVHISQQICDVTTVNTLTSKTNPQASVPESGHAQKNKEIKTCTKCDFIVHTDLHLKKHMKVRHGVRDKMLWVSDSISSNVDFESIEEKIDMDIKSAKAYTTTGDAVGAKFPEKNFLDVAGKELDGASYSVLVIGGGTVEITNLSTEVTPEEDISKFKDEVIKSSQNLFTLAESALYKYSSLEKVIILRRPPRFDPISVDPLELKPQLSKLGDSVLFDLWCNSSFKKKIVLGEHQIPHLLDDDHIEVFGHPNNKSYDGLHMRGQAGRQVFEKSVLNILRNAGVYKAGLNDTKPPEGWKPKNTSAVGWKSREHDRMKTTCDKTSLTGSKPPQYDPMGRMFQRIREVSTNQGNQTMCRDDGSGDVFCPPNGRTSVIKPTNLQAHYSVNVANSFDVLGN